MKKKIYNTIIVILILLYLVVAFYSSHNNWINGISNEEIIREDMLIW